MDAYFDIANLRSYAKSGSNADWKKCNDLLKENCNVHFTFNKDVLRLEKREAANAIMAWITTMASGRQGNIVWNQEGLKKPLTENVEPDLLSAIHFVEDAEARSISQKGYFLISPVGHEIETIKHLFIQDKPIPSKQIRIRDLENWKIFSSNIAPCSDVIVVDPYVFAQSDLLYEKNIYQLLKELLQYAQKIKINIVFFTFDKYKVDRQYQPIPFATIERQLKAKLKEQIKEEPNITFVKIQNKDQHDRTICTNYKTFVSGDSYKYFGEYTEEEKSTTRGEWLYINSLIDLDNQKNNENFIADLQGIINEVKGGLANIIGDRKSNFLQF